MPTLVTMPKWGLTMTSGKVADWLLAEGAEVTAGEPLLVVETEKAINDVEAPAAGILRKIVAAIGDEVAVSGPVAVITAPDESLTDDEIAGLIANAAPKSAGADGRAASGRAAREGRAAARDDEGRINASPAARKLARELGIDLAAVVATGPGGRITSDDVERTAAELAASPEARTESVSLPDGRQLFALLAGPTTTTPPLVFLHGLTGSQTTWQLALPAFVERFRVCALDLPGHGQSDKAAPPAADYSVAGLAAAVEQAMTALGLPSAVLVGHSLGGAVALQIALSRPELVAALVLVNSAGLGDEINAELLDRIEAEPSRDEARRLMELFFHDPRFILERGVEEMYQARLSPGANDAMRAAAAASFDRRGQRIGLAARLGEVAVPTLLLWGAEDRVIPLGQAIAAAQVMPDAWLKVVPGVGHVPQVEASEAFARAVERFVRGVGP